GEPAEGVIAGARRLLLRPQTFMNDSGESVLAAMSFYKIPPEDIVVIHDELDLRPGKVRVKRGGGNAGHNGLRSIDGMIGPDYWRVRIGIGHPGIKELVHPYVLQNFTPDEARLIVMPLLDAVAETMPLLVEGAPDAFMSEVARGFTPPDPLDEEPETDPVAASQIRHPAVRSLACAPRKNGTLQKGEGIMPDSPYPRAQIINRALLKAS